MTDVREMFAQQMDEARTALSRGDRSAAATAIHSAIDAARGDAGLRDDLASALVQLGKLEQELGHPVEAERCLDEAVAVGERAFGAEHPSLAVALNELSRLHIRQSQHARAESVLERLLRITQSKGAEHPDVATALAGLAMVKRALGDHAAAEQRYREALRIREKVLAPAHMAIVVTMEQLSETCAARGNHAEALGLLQRALPTREAALGAEHATVRAMRARIAELTEIRRAANTRAATAPQSRPNDLVFIYEPETPAQRRASQPRARVATPAQSVQSVQSVQPVAAAAVVAAPVVAAPVAPSPAAAATAAATLAAATRAAVATAATAPLTASPVATAPRIESLAATAAPAQRAHSAPEAAVALPVVAEPAAPVAQTTDRYSRLTTPGGIVAMHEASPRRRTVPYLSAGLAVALAIAALTSRSSAGAGRDTIAASAADAQRAALDSTADASNSDGARSASAPTESTTAQSLALLAQAEKRTLDSAAAPAPRLTAAARRLARLTVPVVATTNVDSLVRASTKAGRESEQTGMAGGLRTSPIADETSGTPPVLIGPAPLPYFPDALRSVRTEGEVVVRFRVDERGRVDETSMKVLKSDHPLFTLAVRSVLSRFRFEPALSPAPESKPRADWVDYRAEFTTKN